MSVENWISRVGDVTKKDYGYTFARFMKWKAENGGKFADYSADELVAYQKACSNSDCYEILDVVQRYILSLSDLTYKSKRLYYVTILSFFLHNRCELPKDKSFKVRGDKPKTPSVLRPAHIKEVVLASNPLYGAMITCMLGGAMGIAEVLYWSDNGWEDLRDQLNEGADIIKVDLSGRKGNLNVEPYYTMIGGDALRLLKNYLGPEVPEEREAIFVNPMGRPVTRFALRRYWLKLLFRLKIITKKEGGTRGTRYGCGLHELRDNFRTLWSQSGANPDIGEFFMGHIIDEYGYNQVYREYEYVVEEYRKALHFLNVVSEGFDPKKNVEMQRLREENAALKAAGVNQDVRMNNLEETVERLEKLLLEKLS